MFDRALRPVALQLPKLSQVKEPCKEQGKNVCTSDTSWKDSSKLTSVIAQRRDRRVENVASLLPLADRHLRAAKAPRHSTAVWRMKPRSSLWRSAQALLKD